jgi:polyisoprenoid-binding protein YceI
MIRRISMEAGWPRIIVPLAFVWLAASSSSCLAQQANATASPAAGPTNTSVFEAGDVYLPSSRVYIFVGKTGFGHEHGVVGRLKSGRVRLDVPQQSGQLVFDMRSFVADTEEARKFVGLDGTTDASTQREVNANMQGNAVLDVARYPVSTFTMSSVTRLPQLSSRGLPQYQFVGDFTLHGATQRIQVVADAEEKNGWIHLRGGFTMQQSQFGITPFTKAFGALGVTDQLKVWGDVWLSKERQMVPLAQARNQ